MDGNKSPYPIQRPGLDLYPPEMLLPIRLILMPVWCVCHLSASVLTIIFPYEVRSDGSASGEYVYDDLCCQMCCNGGSTVSDVDDSGEQSNELKQLNPDKLKRYILLICE